MHLPLRIKQKYFLTSSDVPGLTNATGLMGSGINLNGVLIKTIDDLVGVNVNATHVKVPKHSVGFLLIDGKHAACL
jgi:hypothetical protein